MENEGTPFSGEQTVMSTTYVLNSSPVNDISLSLVIGGSGQQGMSTINVFGNSIKFDGFVDEYPLGTNEELNGQKVYIDTVVTNVTPESNNATLTLTLKGGPKDIEYGMAKVITPGSTTLFAVELSFVAF